MHAADAPRGAPPNQAELANPALSWTTLALAGCVALGTDLAASAETSYAPWAAAWSLAMAAAACGAHRLLRRRAATGSPPAGLLLVALGAAFLPVLGDALGRATGLWARPLELLLLAGLRNLGLVLAACALWLHLARLSAALSLFQALFAVALGGGAWLAVWAALVALLGCCWLAQASWFAAATGAAVRDGRSLLGVLALSGLVLAGYLGTAFGPQRAARALQGFLPSSGGNDLYDPAARHGVGDGDGSVAASQNPQSIGFTDSDMYLESHETSLYDVFNETYGEPRRARQQDPAQALVGEMQRTRQHAASGLHAGREFSTVRGPRRAPPRQPGDVAGQALFYLQGRTPLHLRVATYDLFDGTSWREAPASSEGAPVRPAEQPGWLDLLRQPSRSYTSARIEEHTLKFSLWDSNRIPLPAGTARLKIGQLTRVDFFGEPCAGGLHLRRKQIPPSTTVDLATCVAVPEQLTHAHLAPDLQAAAPTQAAFRQLPDNGPAAAQVRALAAEWTRDAPPGWPQVERIVARLKVHCRLVRGAGYPDDCTDACGEFLFRRRAGDAYHFATAAALLLRAQGYATRLVGGFYARPDRYDRWTWHTPVLREDAHVWLEIQAADGGWVPVEPTPGYALLAPRRTWGAALAAWGRAAWSALRAHPLAATATAVGALAAAVFRLALVDALWLLTWRLTRRRRPPSAQLASAWRLVEWRAAVSGAARPAHRTLAAHYAPWWAANTDERRLIERACALADWAAFAPAALRDRPAVAHALASCAGELAATFTRPVWRRVVRREPAPRGTTPVTFASAPGGL